MANTTGKKFGGREKGTLNKRSLAAIEIAEEHECNPIEFLCYVMKGDVTYLKEAPDLDLRVAAAKELASYLFPKLKSIELNDPGRDQAIKETLEAFLKPKE